MFMKFSRQNKKSSKPDPEREERIVMEIVVDAYGEEERAMSWYYYLEGKLQCPFTASCIVERSMSPLQVKDEVEILRMAPEDDCRSEMFVAIRWEKRGLAVPLSQLSPARDEDDETCQAVEDWHYWTRMGYTF
jgi:hypothetical protein